MGARFKAGFAGDGPTSLDLRRQPVPVFSLAHSNINISILEIDVLYAQPDPLHKAHAGAIHPAVFAQEVACYA